MDLSLLNDEPFANTVPFQIIKRCMYKSVREKSAYNQVIGTFPLY